MSSSSSSSLATSASLPLHHSRAPLSLLRLSLPPSSVSFRAAIRVRKRLRSLAGDQDGAAAEMLRKPAVAAPAEREGGGEREGWVDWEDQILEVTVPLVGFVRMILHSGKYESGDKLSPEHEKTILERLLPHHPECEKKIGCGVDYITVGYHPNFESSRCLFIVRKDGELVDFSYWKCIKGLIRKNYPLYADSFILRHFRRRSRND